MNRTIILLSTLFAITTACFSQSVPYSKSDHCPEGMEIITIESAVLNEPKEIFIGLPGNYNDSTRYPLVIVLEGEILFETFAPLTRLMGDVQEIPPSIVVGIPLMDRHPDYAPVISTEPESGNADKMLEFYRSELFPLMGSLYNLSEDRLIWAHSGLGGLFCTYLLLGPDNQFTGILSSSPNLRWMQEYINKEIPFELLAQKKNVFYYLTFGGNEPEACMGTMFQQVQDLSEKLKAEAPENLVWSYQFNENNNHFTNAIETYTEGLILYFDLMR